MMTPQEVSERSFAKASFGGYNMVMVDEFLDQLTVDYTALYKENASLKAKMKVLADSLEEYRATEKGMRRALLAAQQAADEMVKEAESRKRELIRNAEAEAQAKINELHRQVADEEARLNSIQSATKEYVEKIREACLRQAEALDSLNTITASAPTIKPVTNPIDMTAQAIEQSVQKLLEQEDEELAQEAEAEKEAEEEQIEEPEVEAVVDERPAPTEEEPVRSRRDQERSKGFGDEDEQKDGDDVSPTRRIDFDNLQFGSNYDLK